MTTVITNQLIQDIRSEFRLDWRGLHGASHWARVRTNGLTIASSNGASKHVIEYFAFLHDVCRLSDGRDREHGPRAAAFAKDIRKKHIDLADHEFALLIQAIRGHTTEALHENLTVNTCWDADRLDLTRLGITPDPERLCTDAGRQLAQLRAHHPNAIIGPHNTNIPQIEMEIK